MKPAQKILKRIMILAVLIWASVGPAAAGGYDWSFKVVKYYAKTKLKAQIVLKPEAPEDLTECEHIVLEVRYRPEPFWRRTWTGKLVTRDSHLEALTKLAERSQSGESVRIGMIGQGLPEDRLPCSWGARGLTILSEEREQTAVYALHRPV